MYAWIVEADIHRLEKALYEAISRDEQVKLRHLLDQKRGLLAHGAGPVAHASAVATSNPPIRRWHSRY